MIELPNGDNLRADIIVCVRKGDMEHGCEPRVIVDFGTAGDGQWRGGGHLNAVILNCKDNEERDALASRLLAELESERTAHNLSEQSSQIANGV